MEPVPAPPTGGPAIPKLSTTVLFAIAAIAIVVLAAVFGFILFIANIPNPDSRLWWTGFASMIFALGFFILFAATHDRKIARPLAGGFFVVSAGSFYGSIFTGVGTDVLKLVYMIILSILVIIVLGAIFVMARDAEHEAVRKAQRRHIP